MSVAPQLRTDLDHLELAEASWAPVVLQVLVTIAVMLGPFLWLGFKQRVTFGYKPRIRTHVPRGNAESCVFLDRLLQSLFQMGLLHSEKELLGKCQYFLLGVNALVEDSGHATDVDFQVLSLGKQVPRIISISVLGNSSVTATTAGGSPPNTGGTSPQGPVPSVPPTNTGLGAVGGSGGPGSVVGMAQYSPAKTTIEFECELEWESDGFELALRANIPILRGRSLPIAVGVKDVEAGLHAKVKATISEGAKEMQMNVTLISEPCFNAKLHTKIGSWICLKNSFGICWGLKYGLVHLIRKRLVSPGSVSFSAKLPPSLDPHLGSWWNTATAMEPTERSSEAGRLGLAPSSVMGDL